MLLIVQLNIELNNYDLCTDTQQSGKIHNIFPVTYIHDIIYIMNYLKTK